MIQDIKFYGLNKVRYSLFNIVPYSHVEHDSWDLRALPITISTFPCDQCQIFMKLMIETRDIDYASTELLLAQNIRRFKHRSLETFYGPMFKIIS